MQDFDYEGPLMQCRIKRICEEYMQKPGDKHSSNKKKDMFSSGQNEDEDHSECMIEKSFIHTNQKKLRRLHANDSFRAPKHKNSNNTIRKDTKISNDQHQHCPVMPE